MLHQSLTDAFHEGVFASELSSTPKINVQLARSHGIRIQQFDDLDLIVVSKSTSGCNTNQTEIISDLVRDIASDTVGPCKFLVFDFASHGTGAGAESPGGFEALVEDLSNLIFQVPVISVAWVRHDLSGADLELALACSMLIGEDPAKLTFDVDLVDSLRTYALLAHKIGFVQAERLMEGGAVLPAAAAYDLMILHSVASSCEGLDGIRRFVDSRTRRHNSACGLYRAQRIAMLGAP